ncbi:MAG: magnesium/cobalt transporter CorA [Alphaproteobacteria bacterium]|nr:magnesium/cobalt transporter CorA [Alphaproteobacteria bacterium]
MLKTYQLQNGGLKGTEVLEGAPIDGQSLWIDLFNPTMAERRAVDALLGMELPTRADMEEIEVSSRLYTEDGGVFMTALVLSNAESERPTADVVTFVLARDKLITIRYIDPQPFRTFAARCERSMVIAPKAEGVLNALLDVIVDRMADVLERVGSDVEAISREIFDSGDVHIGRRDFQGVLRRLGAKHDLTGKMRECLLTLNRMMSFLATAIDTKATKEARAHVKTLTRDAQSLLDHSSFIAGKLSYLQDATLGLINNEQNNIIKIMSVAAMVFLPPTLIASIYGMNFRYLPELDWPFGYVYSLVLMVISAVVPYIWFKRRGWL